MLRKIVLIVFGLIIFITANTLIYKKERVLSEGKTILLRLGPRDPRSLMQGDYMVLRYAIAVGKAQKEIEKVGTDGRVVLLVSNNGVGEYRRVASPGETHDTLKPNEVFLKFKVRGYNRIRFGAESFFFQEGRSRFFSSARYGELAVDFDGSSVLVGLRDEKLARMIPPPITNSKN